MSLFAVRFLIKLMDIYHRTFCTYWRETFWSSSCCSWLSALIANMEDICRYIFSLVDETEKWSDVCVSTDCQKISLTFQGFFFSSSFIIWLIHHLNCMSSCSFTEYQFILIQHNPLFVKPMLAKVSMLWHPNHCSAVVPFLVMNWLT